MSDGSPISTSDSSGAESDRCKSSLNTDHLQRFRRSKRQIEIDMVFNEPYTKQMFLEATASAMAELVLGEGGKDTLSEKMTVSERLSEYMGVKGSFTGCPSSRIVQGVLLMMETRLKESETCMVALELKRDLWDYYVNQPVCFSYNLHVQAMNVIVKWAREQNKCSACMQRKPAGKARECSKCLRDCF